MKKLYLLLGFLILIGFSSQAQTIADFTVSRDTVCVGDTIFVTDQSSTTNGVITSWNWQFGNSFPATTIQNPYFVVSSFLKGNVPIQLIIYTSTGDSAGTSKTIYVKYVDAGPDRLICLGDTVQLNATGTNIVVWDWTPSSTLSCVTCPNPIASPVSPTVYNVIATDDEGCVHQDSVFINFKNNATILTPSQAVCDSSIILNATPSGGMWSGNGVDTFGNFNPLIAGNGSHWIYYGFDCGMDSILLTVAGQFQPYFTIYKDSCSQGNGSIVIDSISGGSGPYSYNWSNGSTSKDLLNVTAGTYLVTISNNIGCSNNYSLMIQSYPDANLSITGTDLYDNIGCIGNSINLYAYPQNQDTTGLSIQWLSISNPVNDTLFSTSGLITQSGNYGFIISDSVGCSTSITRNISAIDCVWPGDANNDGVANNLDILNIGVAFGSTGRGRDTTTINWIGFKVLDWSQNFSDGTNYKHADCNGDSTINSQDTVAVSLNYGKTHLKTYTQGTMVDPPLYVDQPDTVYPSQVVEAPIILGDVVNTAENVYGIAFTVLYDNTLVDSGSLHLLPATSWLGTLGGDLLKFQKDDYNSGSFDVAYVRKNQQNVPVGFGQIGKLSYILQDDISGKTAAVKPLILSIVNIRAISLDESIIDVFGVNDTTNVALYPRGIEKANNFNLFFYPNPVKSEWLNFESGKPLDEFEIFDVSGKLVEVVHLSGEKKGKLNLAHLDNGIYLIKVFSGGSSVVHKLIMNK